MKTAKMLSVNMAEAMRGLFNQLNKPRVEGYILPYLEQFELEIRKDQDKITRHIAAENVQNSGERFRVDNGIFKGFSILIKDACQTIIDTKAI